MPTVVTNYFKEQEGGQNVSVSGDNWICSLMDSYVSASLIDTLKDHQLWSEAAVSGNEVSGTGYTSGTQLSNVGWFTDDTNNIQRLSASDITFSNVTITSYGSCIWRLSDGLIMGFIDFGAAKITTNGNFTINWATGGILNKN